MRVCVTGASAGIGASIAQEFAKRGHDLILGARRVQKLETLRNELIELGSPRVTALPLDVTDNTSVDKFCSATLEASNGALDVLINNAGLALGVDHVSDGNIEDWQRVLDTNVTGILRVTRKLLPSMKDHNHGHLIFLSSIAAHQPYAGGSVYCATKHALKAIAAALKIELNGTNIRVSTLDPGLVETEFSKVRFKGDETKADAVYSGLTPLTAKDIAECAVFVASRPAHVNIDQMIIMPTDQATVHHIHRT